MWGDVSGTVGGGGNDRSNGRWTVVSSDKLVVPKISVIFSAVRLWCGGRLAREYVRMLLSWDLESVMLM